MPIAGFQKKSQVIESINATSSFSDIAHLAAVLSQSTVFQSTAK